MKQLTCIAIDDEPLALELLEKYVSRIPSLKMLQTFEDPISASEFIRQNQVDLLFVDINMPDISGIELVKSLDPKPMIVFATAYKNFAFEGFELQAIDYLLKPIDFERFSKAVNKAIDLDRLRNAEQQTMEQKSLYVYSEYRMIKIDVQDIEYIESMEDYIKINLASQPEPVLTLMTLKKVLEKLPQESFSRIHRSYIVSLSHIKSIHNKKVQLKAAELPIGKSYSQIITRWSK